MSRERYLTHFRPDLLSGNVDEIVQAGRPQDKTTLIEYLGGALENLKTFPGPHLYYRSGHADDWIGWWVDFLEKDSVSGQLITFDKIKDSLIKGNEYGVLFAGGMEGHRGHRFAVDHMLKYVCPILLLERDSYIESKPRGGPYLDLRARISMWANYDPRIIVSVLPEMPGGVNPNVHYKNLFDRTGADYCFASESDPYCWEKVARGKPALFTVIPSVSIQSTTNKAEGLLNTTDNVSQLLPGADPAFIEHLQNNLEHDLTEI